MTTIPVAVRITSEQLAKARDGLIAIGIKPKKLLTRSNILRCSVYLAITMGPKATELPSEESLSITASQNK